jgi:DNA-binding LytR/AlgR family response regulator
MRIIIVDDEPIWAMQLQLLAEKFDYTVAGVFNTVSAVLVALPQLEFDLALIDIELDGENLGIELGKHIGNTYNKPFVYVTGSLDKHTAKEVSLTKPIAYLTKPINETSFCVAIEQAKQNMLYFEVNENNEAILNQSIFIKVGNKHKKILWKDVVALQSEKKYTKIIVATDDADYFINHTLTKAIELIVPKIWTDQFIQINRAEVVNIEHIKELKGNTVVTSTKSFQATEGYLQKLKKMLHII